MKTPKHLKCVTFSIAMRLASILGISLVFFFLTVKNHNFCFVCIQGKCIYCWPVCYSVIRYRAVCVVTREVIECAEPVVSSTYMMGVYL